MPPPGWLVTGWPVAACNAVPLGPQTTDWIWLRTEKFPVVIFTWTGVAPVFWTDSTNRSVDDCRFILMRRTICTMGPLPPLGPLILLRPPSKTYSVPSGVISTRLGENCPPLLVSVPTAINIDWPPLTRRFDC